MSEKKLGDGEPSPPPDSKIRQALMTHWLSQIECNHYEKSDSAICACGWKSERGFNVGKAVELWIDHVFLESGAAQEVSPPSPLNCCGDAHASYDALMEHVKAVGCELIGRNENGVRIVELRNVRAEKAEGDTRELKAALWISVQDKLPTTGDAVLFGWWNTPRNSSVSHFCCEIGMHRTGEGYWEAERTAPQDEPIRFADNSGQVTHWMPLPKPPKGL